MQPIAKIEHLSKTFRLPQERYSSLKQTVVNLHRRRYETLTVLDDISFEIGKGEFFGIVGRNGSGKSTLLKILAGIYQPSGGSVKLNGHLTPFIELGVGFNMELTARDNIYLNGTLLGLNRKTIRGIFREIVAFAELEKFIDQKLKNYSSGMLVRLAFSIAIRAHSDILLVDEVLAVGDASFQHKCFQVFKDIKKQGKTVIFVSHDMGAIQEYCDRALMIKEGKIVALGKPRDIALGYELENVSSAGKRIQVGSRPEAPAAKLETLKVVDGQGRGKSSFRWDEDIVAEVRFTVSQSQAISFNLFLVAADGTYVAGYNTKRDLGEYTPKSGSHTVRCRFRGDQLVKGTYNLNLAAYEYDQQILIDALDSSLGVETPVVSIAEQSPYQDGQFYIDGQWQAITKGKP